MSHQKRSARARKASAFFALFRVVLGASALFVSFTAMVAPAAGPGTNPVPLLAESEPVAVLAFDGQRPMIVGSVAGMFDSAVFVEPERDLADGVIGSTATKIALAKTFGELHARFATLKQEREFAVASARPSVAVAMFDPTKIRSNSAAANSALAAIDAVAGQDGGGASTTQLAYARGDAQVGSGNRPSDRIAAKQIECLKSAIYFEARGESYRGQVAVAQVVMNRVKSTIYPNTICGVVYQNQHKRNACQFSFACDGIPERVNEPKPWAQADEIARKVLDGHLFLTEVANATHYHAKYVHPKWAPRMAKVTSIGLHIFYRFKNRG